MSAQGKKDFYRDLPESTAGALRDLLEPHSLMIFMSPITQAGWESVPSSYVFAPEDGAISIAFQKFMVDRARKEIKKHGGRSQSFSGDLGTVTIDTGHFGPYYTKVTELTDYLAKLAKCI